MAKLYDSKEYMRMLFVKKNMTPEEIAEKLNASRATIYRALRKHGLIK